MEGGLLNLGEALTAAAKSSAFPVGHVLNRLLPLPVAPPPEFSELYQTPLAARLRNSNKEYGWLLGIREKLDSFPGTVGRRLRMRILEGKTTAEISTAEGVIKNSVDGQLSTALAEIMDELSVPREKDLRQRITRHVKRFDIQRNLYPWLEWYKLWKEFPADVMIPPNIYGLLSEEIWNTMELGTSYINRGIKENDGSRPSDSGGSVPTAERRRFIVEPFEVGGFIGLKILPKLREREPFPDLIPPEKVLAIGVHAELLARRNGVSKSAMAGGVDPYCPAQAQDEFSPKDKKRAYIFRIPHPTSSSDKPFRDAESPRGAMTLLAFGYGPINMKDLLALRPLYEVQDRRSADRLADSDPEVRLGALPVFGRGVTKLRPNGLTLHPGILKSGFKSYTFGFSVDALRILMARRSLEGASLTVRVHQYDESDSLGVGSNKVSEVAGFVDVESVSRHAIVCSSRGFGKWHNTNDRWVRCGEVRREFGALLEMGEGMLPALDPLDVRLLRHKPPRRAAKMVQLKKNKFTIPPDYKESTVCPVVYLHKRTEHGAPFSDVIVALYPCCEDRKAIMGAQPVVIYSTPVGKLPEGQRRKWTSIKPAIWEKIVGDTKLCSRVSA